MECGVVCMKLCIYGVWCCMVVVIYLWSVVLYVCSYAFMERSESIQTQLKNLRADMDSLKVEEKQTHLDKLHDEGIQRGDTKYQTLQKVCSITTQISKCEHIVIHSGIFE